jgi:hypothetical protein
MAERNRPHLFIEGQAAAERYRRPNRKMDPRPLPTPGDRPAHAQSLKSGLEAAAAQGQAQREPEGVEIAGVIPGIYVTFESFPGIDLAFEKLDPRQGKIHPQLRAVREVIVNGNVIEQATVFIPDGKLGYFLKRIEQYAETTGADKPRNFELRPRRVDRPRIPRKAVDRSAGRLPDRRRCDLVGGLAAPS